MTAKRYAVADATGNIINHIFVDDPLPKGYWPGYGKYLLPLETVDTSNGGGGLDILEFKFDPVPQIGDTVNLDTGEVTKFVPEVKSDPKSGELCASAPDVKFSKDAEPKPDGGTVVVKNPKLGGATASPGGKTPK